MLGRVVEVVSSIPTVGHKKYFSAFSDIVDLLYLCQSIFIMNIIYIYMVAIYIYISEKS